MVFVADDAFPLTKHYMKPYGRKNLSDEERIFDYRFHVSEELVKMASEYGLIGSDYLQHVLH